MHFGPCYMGSKGLQQACNKLELNRVVGEAFVKLQLIQELEIWQSFLLFFVAPAEKNRAIWIKYDQTHFESVLGYYTSLKIYEQNVKNWHRRKSPQGGWWIGSKEPIWKDIFFLFAVIWQY